MMKVCVQPRSGGRRAYSVRPEKRRGLFSLSPREERAGRELERGETDEKRPPLPGPLLLFWGREGEGNRRCGPSKLLAEHYWLETRDTAGLETCYSVVATLNTYPHRMRGERDFCRVRGVPAHDVDRKITFGNQSNQAVDRAHRLPIDRFGSVGIEELLRFEAWA